MAAEIYYSTGSLRSMPPQWSSAWMRSTKVRDGFCRDRWTGWLACSKGEDGLRNRRGKRRYYRSRPLDASFSLAAPREAICARLGHWATGGCRSQHRTFTDCRRAAWLHARFGFLWRTRFCRAVADSRNDNLLWCADRWATWRTEVRSVGSKCSDRLGC